METDVSNDILPEVIRVMGVPVTPFASYAEAVDCVGRVIASRRKTLCVAMNPEKLYRAQRDAALRSLLRSADIGICDGVGVALAARLLYGRRLTRCTGVDLFQNLVAAAATRGWKVFLLGASPESNETASRRLVEQHPGLRIVGRQDGYFGEVGPVIEQINASGADMLFVAMGSPRQEFWITEHRAALDVPFFMGVGGTLDVISGAARRAPAICRRTGTEFLYRLLSDPRRVRRQWVLPAFAAGVIREALRRGARPAYGSME